MGLEKLLDLNEVANAPLEKLSRVANLPPGLIMPRVVRAEGLNSSSLRSLSKPFFDRTRHSEAINSAVSPSLVLAWILLRL